MAKKCIKNLVFAIVELFILILIEAQANDTFFNPPSLSSYYVHPSQLDKSYDHSQSLIIKCIRDKIKECHEEITYIEYRDCIFFKKKIVSRFLSLSCLSIFLG